MSAFNKDFGVYNCGEDLKGANDKFIAQLNGDDPTSPSFILVDMSTNSLVASKCKGGSTKCSKAGCESSANSVNSSLINFFNTRHDLFVTKKALNSTVDQINISLDCVKTAKAAESGSAGKIILYIVILIVLIALGVFIYRRYKK